MDELTILVRSGDHSWSFWSIPINSNTVLLMHVISAGQWHESFELFKTFVFPRRIIFISVYAHCTAYLLYSVRSYCILVVLMPQSHCAESTPEWGWIDNSSLFEWSFLVILAMTMTMTINSNSVLLIRVASAGQYESFKLVQKVCVPSMNNFHSCLKRVFVRQIMRCILVMHTVYYVIRTCNISDERSANVTW